MSKYSSLGLPDGWFAACFSHELAPGSLVSRTLFDRQLVLFRTSAGEAAVFDAHCPHMGAHFGHGGRVEGETLRCPFHGFSFATDGSCVATPYETKIPPKCRAGRWHVRERDGVVLVWHHHAGAEPSWDIPAIDHEGWSAPRTRVWRLPTHPQETSENSVDIGHFTEVHGYSDVSVIEPLRTEGPYLTSTYAMTRRGPGPVATRTHFKVHVHGLGYSFVEAEVPDMDVHLRHWVMCTPSEGGLCELRTCSSIRRSSDRARCTLPCCCCPARSRPAWSPARPSTGSCTTSSRTSTSGRTRPTSIRRCSRRAMARSGATASGVDSSTRSCRRCRRGRADQK